MYCGKKEYLNLENLFFYTNVCQKWVSFVYFLATSAKMSAKSCQKQRILAFFWFWLAPCPKIPNLLQRLPKTHTMSRFCDFQWLVQAKASKWIERLPKNINSARGICSLPDQPRLCLRAQSAGNLRVVRQAQISFVQMTNVGDARYLLSLLQSIFGCLHI